MSGAALLTVVIPWRGDPRLKGLCQRAGGSRATDAFQILIVVDGKSTPYLEKQLTSYTSNLAPIVATAVVENTAGEGPGASRNVGLRHVNTPYISFADSDDAPDFDELVRATRFMQATDTQVLVGGYTVARGQELIRRHHPEPGGQFDEELIDVAGVWRFVFETAFLRGSHVEFPTTSYGEDAVFLLELHGRHPRFASWPASVYTYRDHSSAQRLTASRARSEDLRRVATRLWLLAKGRDSRTRDLARYWLVRMALHQRDLGVLTGPEPGWRRPLPVASGLRLLSSSVRLHRIRRRLRRRDYSMNGRLKQSTGSRAAS